MNSKCLYLPLVALSSVIALDASPLFTDNFDDRVTIGSGTATSGWTVSDNTRVYVINSTSDSTPNSLFMRHSGTRTAKLSSAVAITDTTQDLVFSFDYKGGPNSLESGDFMSFMIDFGGGYETVLTDAGLADGYTGTYSGSLLSPDSDPVITGAATDFLSYSVIVPSSYYSGTLSADSFNLQLYFNSGSDNENGYFDNVSVAAVPEPSQYAVILGLSGLLLALRRRRS